MSYSSNASKQEGMVLQLADGSIQGCNANTERILGFKTEQIQGLTSFAPNWQAIHKDGSPFPGETHPGMIALQTGKPCLNVVMGLYKPSGELIWLLLNSEPLFRGNESKPYGVITTFTDITEEKQEQDEWDACEEIISLDIKNKQDQWSILIVDDSAEDRETYRRYLLTDPEYNYRIVEAELGEEGVEQCKRCQPDVILLDYLLSDLDGLEFLEQLQQQSFEHPIPVILLTGQGNEVVAVQAMKAGVSDYLIKGEITPDELQLAVKDAIQKAQLRIQLKQAQQARGYLLQREKLVMEIAQQIRQSLSLEEILNTTVREVRQFLQSDRVIIFRLESSDFGRVLVESVGVNSTSILSTQIYDPCFNSSYIELYLEGRVKAIADIHKAQISQCHIELLERYQIKANLVVPILQNSHLWGLLIVQQCSVPREWQQSEIELLKQLATQLGIAIYQAELYEQAQTEIAERKQTEEELRKSQKFIEEIANTTPGGLYIYDAIAQRNVYQNSQVLELLGYTSEEIQGMGTQLLSQLMHPDDLVRLRNHFERLNLTQANEILGFEYRMRRFDGQWRWFYSRDKVFSRTPDGRLRQVIGVAQDITEKKQVEIELRSANERFELAAAAVKCLIYDWDLQSDRVNRSCGLTEVFGYQLEEAEPTAQWWQELVYPDDLQQINQDFTANIAKINSYCSEYRVRHKNGHYLWVEDRVVLVRNAEGTPIRFVGSTTDISERKRSLIELQETAERLRMAQRAAHAGWWDWDMVTNQVSWSEEYYDLFGIEPTVVPSYHDWLDSIVKEDRERIERETREAIEQRQEINIEFRVQHPIRGIRWLNAIGKTSYREGQPVRMTGITLDITGRKQAEEAIQEKEQQLSFALEAANMVAYNWNIKSDRVIQSENAAYVLGLPLGTTIQTGAEFFSLIHPDDRERVIEAINHTHAGKQEYVCEFRLLCPDGNIRWMADRGWMSFDESGLPLCLSGMIFEITNRKKSEAALRESVAILNAINKATPTLIFAKDRSGRMIMANPATINLIGKSEAEIIGHTALDFLSDRTEGEKIRENDRQVIEIGEVKVFEETVEFEAGKRIFLSTKSPYRDEQGNIIGLIGISTDITERKQTEEKLIQQAQLLDLAYEAILVRDLDSRITYWNNSAREMYGWTSDEASGQISHTLLQTKYCNAAAKSGSIEKIKSSCVGVNQDSVLLETAQWKGELIHTCKGGTEITVESRQVLVIDNQGNPIKILEVNRDITERKQSEEALRRSEEFNRRILDSSKDCIKVLDLEGRLLYINEGGQKLLEIEDLTTCLNQDWICFWQDADRESLHRAIATAKSGGIGTFEGYCRTAKDTPKWWEVVISPMLDATGEVERLLCIARDITARKQAQTEREQILARLQQYAKQLQGLTEAALATNSALSLEEVLNTITEQARSIIGAHQSVTSITVDQDWAQAIHSISLSDKYAAWRDYQESPDGSGIYACVCNSNLPMRMTQAELEAHPRWHGFGKAAGSHPPLRGWLAAPLVAKDGRNMGLIHLSDKYEGEFSEEDEAIAVQLAQMASVAIENSRLYEAEQKACSQAEAANRVKDEFLAILSHELRSPLNPILGWTQLLQTYQFDAEKNNQAIVTIERNAKLLNQLIDDLLDVNRILRGKLTLDVAPINLVFIIEAALETVNTAATAKSITIQTNLCSVAYVSGDSGRLQQIIWNLLSNAVKFTPHGGRVEIKLECINNQAQISISDTGRGIAPEFLPYVFEYFRQADASVTRKHGGLGLGLAIVRYLVELHGGEVAAESPGVGQGATFTVSLPLVKAQNLSNHKNEFFKETIDLTGVRVLIVDDEIDTREFLVLMLQQYKAEATSVSSAMEVSLALRTFKPNILVSDIGMPVIDGYTLLRSIRSLPPEEGGQIPAIALTAYAREEDRQQALSAGFQRHLAKPIEPNILAEAIISILANWREAQHLYP